MPAAGYISDVCGKQRPRRCAGTGGSILIIGSAAGVVVMGLEKISFSWYMRHISWIAITGFLAGIGIYYLQNLIF